MVEVLSPDVLEMVRTAEEEVDEITGTLQQLITIITRNTIQNTSDGFQIQNKLTPEELYALALRIPAECAFIQEHINALNLSLSVQQIRTNNIVTGNIETLREGKGDAKERLRRAERMTEAQIIQNEIRQQIIKALQGYIDRADKVYEGVKKIIDSMNREWNFDRKTT